MQNQIPQPKPDEQCEDFCVRAHRELAKSMPDVDARNQAVWGSWDMARGGFTVERYRAQGKFAGWRMIPDVCHFAEHETSTKMGPLKVGSKEIAETCRNMNRRIRVGLHPPLINKHTSGNPAEHESTKPYIVGYAANYRIGMITDGETERYAIFGDEHHKPEHLQELNGKPRRSVELIRYKDSARNFFDPVACLGPESPRIEIPPAYYSIDSESGVETVRYSVAAPVYAGSSNTFIQSFGDDKERMQATAEPQTENVTMLQPEDLAQVIDAFKNFLAPYLPALEAMSNGQMGQQPGMPAPGAPAPGMPAPGGQPGGDELAIGGPTPGSAPAPAAPAPHQPPAHPPAAHPGQQPVKYAESEGEESEVVQYSQLQALNQTLIQECGQLKARLGRLETERTDAIRSHRLNALANRFSGIVDFDEESSKVLYSAGSEMDDEDFDAHLEMIERYAAKAAPPMEMVPGGEAQDDGEDNSAPIAHERYSARVQNEVVRRMSGEPTKYASYEAAEVEVCRDLGIK